MDENIRNELIARIKKLRLMDDFFMVRFFEGNIEATELVLRIILNRKDIHVKSVQVQQTIKSIAGRGYPVYEIENTIKQNNKKIDDGVHILYVNGEYRGNDDMGKLMEDFNNPEPDSMNYDVIRLRSKHLKEEKGEGKMCAFTQEVLDMGRVEGVAIGRAEGLAEGEAKGRNVFVEMMLRANEPVSKIRQYTQLTIEQIQAVAKSIGVAVVM